MKSELLGQRQHEFLRALATLEADHGPSWFYVHAVIRAVAGVPDAAPRSPYRMAPDAERLNPYRVFQGLERRGLVQRHKMLGIGSSVRLTGEGRSMAAAAAR
jgi:hypothetical protein